MAALDLTKNVAERTLKQAMAPLRDFLDSDRNTEEISGDDIVGLTVAQVREMDRFLGAIGVALANRYAEQEDFQVAIEVLALENVRLHELIPKEEKSSFNSDVVQ